MTETVTRFNSVEALMENLNARLSPLERAQQALENHTAECGMDMESCCLFVDGPTEFLSLPHDDGEFNLSDFRALVHAFTELKDGLTK